MKQHTTLQKMMCRGAFEGYLLDRRRRAPLKKCGTSKLDSTVHGPESDTASESRRSGRWKGGLGGPGEEKGRLSVGFGATRPPRPSRRVAPRRRRQQQQPPSFGPNPLCAGASAASCGMRARAERTPCPPPSSNEKVIQGGSGDAHALRACVREGSRSGVNSLYRCEGNGTKHRRTFCFPSSLSLCSTSQMLALLNMPRVMQPASTTRHPGRGEWEWEGGCEAAAVLRRRHMPPCTCSAVQAGSPPEVFGWVSVRSGTHLKWRCFSHGEG